MVLIGFPHRLERDDVYKSYFIPKGATIMVNIWSLTRNPDLYADPDVFDPNRFLDPESPAHRGSLGLQRDVNFGFGRRVCIGQDLAVSLSPSP